MTGLPSAGQLTAMGMARAVWDEAVDGYYKRVGIKHDPFWGSLMHQQRANAEAMMAVDQYHRAIAAEKQIT